MGDAFHKREGGIHNDRREGGIGRRRGQVEGLNLLESPSNLLGRIAIVSEDLAEMVKLQIKVVCVTNSMGSQSKGLKNANFLARMVVGGRMDVQISVRTLAKNTTTKGSIRFPDDKDIKER